MDYSTKATTKTTTAATGATTDKTERRHNGETHIDAASSPLGADQQEGIYPCPACPIVLLTPHLLSNHLRGHNSPRSTDYSGEDDYTCGVCHKVLSSASSLDRHVLVHSGERPFKCKYCDMAFTTNGNMNRHLRTAHGGLSPQETSYTDSEGSSDSEKPTGKRRHDEDEYNNNEISKTTNSVDIKDRASSPTFVAKRQCLDLTEIHMESQTNHTTILGNARTEINGSIMEPRRAHNCPFCNGLDFSTRALLEAHLDQKHPEFPATCETCNHAFKNNRVLNRHKCIEHNSDISEINNARNRRNSVVGFDDLTFVDFSSDKFPTIARAVCEQSVHRPASGEVATFQCTKCSRAFPCRSALDGHEMDCGMANPSTSHSGDDSSRRDDFFAGLDLQNTAALTEAKDGKDLADIASIISVTSGPILQNFPPSDSSTPEHENKENPNLDSSVSSGTLSSESHQEEEAQDVCAADFRKMKLISQFPCKLCGTVFPNLRALKGHNRVHMGAVEPGMPYSCNMCDYTNTDKATVVRHLRSHNGDRPFECSLCNYAFTTKANCERHVRNRHGKLTRDEIKSVLIYHPSEDHTNDSFTIERNSPRGNREDARKILVYTHERDDNSNQKAHCSGMPKEMKQERGNISDDRHTNSMGMHTPRRTSSLGNYERSEGSSRTRSRSVHSPEKRHRFGQHSDRVHNDLMARSDFSVKREDEMDSSEDESVSLVSDAQSSSVHQSVDASPLNLKKGESVVAPVPVEETPELPTGEDAPLDLTMDVLDLSRGPREQSNTNDSTPVVVNHEDIGRNQREFYDATNQFLLTQALLRAGQAGNPATSFETLYANAQVIYENFGGFSAAGVGAGILPPYLFNPHMFSPDFTIEDRLHRELIRGLQLTSGGTLVEPSVGNTAYAGAYPQGRDIPAHSMSEQGNYAEPISTNLPAKVDSSREKIENSPTSNSVKMVIKNGVLMPKQKQRRYRTERPFTCEHCSARFTLRSNMERHIKQQHPHHWSQRPRGGHSTRGRPPANPPTLLHNANHHGNQQLPQALPSIPTTSHSTTSGHAIPDHVKYAILAQHLKGNKTEENDTDEELVIDEETNEREIGDEREVIESKRTTSLLRVKLEGSNLYKDNNIGQPKQQQNVETIKNNSAKDDDEVDNEYEENEADDADFSGDENSTRKIKSEQSQHHNEDDSTYCTPGDLCTTEMVKDKHHSHDGMSEKNEDGTADLASVSELLDNASQQYQQFQPQYMSDEEGLVASTSDCNNSGSDEKSDSINSANSVISSSSMKKKKIKKKKKKKKSAYSMAPNRVICPYCERPFPWTSSLRRHILTHTGQKPYQCMHCSLLFTTKSNCDRHLLRKHKNNVNKIRRMRNSSSPEAQEQPSNNNNNNNNNNNSSAFAMRNVPERPYKCNICPSSTFSTLGNLKKHKSSKHSRGYKSSRPESPVTSEPQNSPIAFNKHNDQSGYESQSSSISDNIEQVENMEIAEQPELQPEHVNDTIDTEENQDSAEIEVPAESNDIVKEPENIDTSVEKENTENSETNGIMGSVEATASALDNATSKINDNVSSATNEALKSRRPSPRSSPGPADSPFKCHLCDGGFSERQDCLEHIRINHTRSYEILVEKGALDMDIETPEEQQQPPPQHNSDGEEKRGKFPDYSNRKVVCAFCMRRFWSAEDLRRHMRTHTGERPFSCDICCRRFTLKHSMLRHRKKHESVDSAMYIGTSGDEESVPSQPPTITPRSQQQQGSLVNTTGGESRVQERISLLTVATVATGDAAPSGLMHFNPYDNLTGQLVNAQQNFLSHDGADSENDLISNLLGIRDKSIIDRMLQASADDAAKFLGVNRNHD